MELINPDDLAVATIIGEAESEGYDGMLGVAKIIRNRMKLRYASDGTVAGTVLRPLQFSFWNSNSLRRDDVCNLDVNHKLVSTALSAWRESKYSDILPDTAVLYHTVKRPTKEGLWPPQWAERVKKEMVIGAHVFYSDPA